MTDEKLVAELRHPRQRNERYYEPLCARAADEIERLAALAQSDAEPVEWRPQVRPEVAAFALLMERELRNNDHKPGWKEDAPDSLARRIVEEAAELLTVATSYEAAALSPVPRKTREQIAEEAADVANMAMMVADVCGALRWGIRGERT